MESLDLSVKYRNKLVNNLNDKEYDVVIVGGKLTTYRCMATKVIYKIYNYLERKVDLNNAIDYKTVYYSLDEIEIQVEKYLKYSMVINLIDRLDRRLNLYRFNKSNGIEYLDLVVEKMSDVLKWDNLEIKN